LISIYFYALSDLEVEIVGLVKPADENSKTTVLVPSESSLAKPKLLKQTIAKYDSKADFKLFSFNAADQNKSSKD
jgi:hypothetical protein